MTEEEARKKWCPYRRATEVKMIDVDKDYGGPLPVSFRAPVGLLVIDVVPAENGDRCIASDCMMWRPHWDDMDENFAEDDGYCGLAGKW